MEILDKRDYCIDSCSETQDVLLIFSGCLSNKLNTMFRILSPLLAGQERFTSMTRVYYRDAHACIIMFDLTQRSTFLNASKWKKDLDSKCVLPDGTPVPCVLLANKVSTQPVFLAKINTLSLETYFLLQFCQFLYLICCQTW